jgi:hypothetical protein
MCGVGARSQASDGIAAGSGDKNNQFNKLESIHDV